MTKTTEAKWRSLIAEQQRSGLTVREFAELRGITPTTLYWWRSKLGGRRQKPDLVPVEVVESCATMQAASIAAFELDLGDSVTLRVPAGFDEADLRRLVRALRC